MGMKRLWKPVVMLSVLVATIVFFAQYFATHPAVRHQLGQTSPGVLLGLLGLYFVIVLSLVLVSLSTLRLCNVRLPLSEISLVTMYSSVVNFFGPLQSGPAFRAVYLKKRHGVNLKNYAMATLAYYAIYALISGVFLLSGLLKWWVLVLPVAAALVFIWVRRSKTKLAGRFQQLNLGNWYYLVLATLFQLSLGAIIFYIELRSIAPGTHFSQAIVYTGAASLAMFVSITPGAIGFRESFLLFSQHLHHISSSSIVAANVIDRSLYIVLLLILAVIIFGTHTNRLLRKRINQQVL